ncbi:hypothetical protein vseg_005266 [Gypsophila vaccaria]
MSISKIYDPHCVTLLFLIFAFILSSNLRVALASTSSLDYIHRVDPLRHFKHYDGGYDLRNKHYWASAAFTGIHGYAMAGALLLCGLGCGIFMMTKYIILRTHGNSHTSSATTTNYSDFSYYFLLFLLLLFTFLAMIATGFALMENQKTVHRTNKVKDTVLGAGNVARRTIHRVNKVIKSIQNLLCPYDQSTCVLLNTTVYQLGSESHSIQQFMLKNGHTIDQAIWVSYITNVVIMATNLLCLVGGLVLLLLHWHPGLLSIILVCWILAMACWAMTGLDFFLHTFAEDTCTALEDFVNNPLNSSLSSLLPCADALKSQSIVLQLSRTVHDFITQLNSNINIMTKELVFTEVNHVNNVLGNKQICDPFAGPPDYQYLEGKCPAHAIPIRDLPDILARFTCENETTSNSCTGRGKFLPRTAFLMAYAYIRSVESLIDIYPDLENLIHCSFVKDRISDVVSHQCKPYKSSTRLLWTSVICLSSIMVVLLSLWLAKAFQEHGKRFTHCSIVPIHEEA